MTTIAYKDGIIAYDSRETCGITIMSDDADKKIIKDGNAFFLCGATHQCVALAESWPKAPEDKNDAFGFVATSSGLYMIGMDGDQPYKYKQEVYWAVGSGGDHALTAMDLGMSAKEAVKIAAKRDTCTGGRIRTFKVPKK